MPNATTPALLASRILLELIRAFNLLVGVGLLLALPASFLFDAQLFAFFSKRPSAIDASWLLPILRLWVIAALAMVALAQVFLSRLLAVLRTVGAGDPFVPENAARLQTIAWCGLAIQLLHLLFGIFAAGVNAAGSDVDWSFSLNGWLAVVLLFVLAQVFEHGTRIRDDLGTMI